ncbi:MAG: MmgE/PrpD family protein [Lysinibacillus sp.]
MNDIKLKATYELANFAASFREQELVEEDRKKVAQILLDYYCAAITGSKTETSQLVLKYLMEAEGMGKAKVIGSDIRLSVANAAFVNGTSAHCLDFDDGHTHGSVHPAAPIIPAVMAVAEDIAAAEEDVIRAIIVGYEVCLRIAAAVHPNSRKRGFHNTPIAGIFGAAAAVGYLYELEAKEIESALGVAASFAGGLFAFLGTGSEVKRIHPGQAARDGIHAVKLSMSGLKGPDNVLEGNNGFFQAFAGEINEQRFMENLGEKYEIHNIYFKPYPCCRHLHVVIDIVYEMKKRYQFDTSQISTINIGVNQIAAMHNHSECKTLLDAQMSMPYAVALALCHDSLHVDLFDPANASAETQRLIHKMNIYIDEKSNRLYPTYRAGRVQIMMHDQQVLEYFADNPAGEPTTPLTDDQMKDKFLSNCEPILGKDQALEVLDSIMHEPIRLDELLKL